MRTRDTRGFTLIELAVVMVIGAVLSGALLAWLSDGRAAVEHETRALRFSQEARATLTRVASEARSSEAVEVRDGALRLSTDGQTITYRVQREPESAPVLIREAPDGRTVMARDLAELALKRSAGRLDVALRFAASFQGYRPHARYATTVALPREVPR